MSGEQVVLEVSAVMEGAGGLGNGKLRVTTERLVFERRTMTGRAGDVTSLALSSIQSAGIKGVVDKKLTVRAGSTEVVFKSGFSANGEASLKGINDLLQRALAGTPLQGAGAPAPELLSAAAGADSSQWIDELERLAKLHAAGALDETEFAAAKSRLLDRP